MKLLWLSDQEVREVLTMEDAILVMEKAFREHGLGRVQMPPKIYLDFKQGDLRAMPAYLEEEDIAGVKIVNVHPMNPGKNLPTVMALLILNDPSTGAPLAAMDATFLTDIRTGAAGGIAAKYLARKDSKVVGLVGAGRQARTQLLAISKVFDLDVSKVTSRSISACEKFREEMKGIVECEIKSNIEAVCDCDILVTTTPVRNPIVMDAWIQDGTHINAIGADASGKEEMDPRILERSKIIVDDLAQAAHSGEINVPISKGIISNEEIYGELGEVVLGMKGRENDKEVTIFDSTGLAIQDISTGKLVYEKAMEMGLGIELKMF